MVETITKRLHRKSIKCKKKGRQQGFVLSHNVLRNDRNAGGWMLILSVLLTGHYLKKCMYFVDLSMGDTSIKPAVVTVVIIACC